MAEAEDELIIMEAEKQRRIVDGEKDDSFIRSIEMRRKLIKWARIFKAKTLSELEAIAGDEEVLKSMVTYIRELSEDEKIRQQCQAREDYERRLIGEYNRGNREGREEGAKNMLIDLVKSGDISIEMAADKLGMSSGEFAKLI